MTWLNRTTCQTYYPKVDLTSTMACAYDKGETTLCKVRNSESIRSFQIVSTSLRFINENVLKLTIVMEIQDLNILIKPSDCLSVCLPKHQSVGWIEGRKEVCSELAYQ